MLRARRLRQALTVLCLVVAAVELTGCSTISKHMIDQEYYLVEPSIASIQNSQESKKDPCSGRPYSTAISQVSDQNVVIYVDCVKKMLRRRMNLARIARLTSSSFAVLTAAAAAALGATAAAPLTAITALAASSAVIPEFSRIFGADERAHAYQEGVSLIEDAEGKYLVARAEARAKLPTSTSAPVSPSLPGTPNPPASPNPPGTPNPPAPPNAPGAPTTMISASMLTVEGAKLYVQTVASIKIVEQLLVAALPKIEDIQLAQGKATQPLSDFQVEPAVVTLANDGDVSDVLVLGATVKHAASSAPNIVDIDNRADLQDGTQVIRVKRIAQGADVTITVATDSGRTGKITVKAP
jgi:hypothetical protein